MGKKTKRWYDPALVPDIPSRVDGMRWSPAGEAILAIELARAKMLKEFARRIAKLEDDHRGYVSRQENKCACFLADDVLCPLHPDGYIQLVDGVIVHTSDGVSTMMNVAPPEDC